MSEPAKDEQLDPGAIAAAGLPVLARKARAATLALTAAAARQGAQLGQPDGDSSRLSAESLARRVYVTPQLKYPRVQRPGVRAEAFAGLDVDAIEVEIDASFVDITIPVDIVDLAVVELLV
ncbi:hypothetical protein ABZW10_24545 [Kitasatospora sp. NPDC004723]|uniref:hypothetical protein n=1 Tax=Kitasatospora sp. NPDC004723 TaxID=3154288 RepID=UPI0033A6BC13